MKVIAEIQASRFPIKDFIALMEARLDGRVVDNFYEILAGRARTFIIDEPGPLVDMLVASRLCESKSEAKRLVSGGAVKVSGKKETDPKAVVTRGQFDGDWLLLEVGRDKLTLFLLENLGEVAAAASHVVDMFDQADTGSMIRVHGGFSSADRREALVEAVDALRAALARTQYKSIFPSVGEDGRPT